MADTDEAEGVESMEAPDEEVDEDLAALLQFGKYKEARQALPWEQWTHQEKLGYYLDRIFLGLLAVIFLVFIGEICYKLYYVTTLNKLPEFVMESVVFLFNWLFTQDRQEELKEEL